MEDWKKRLKSAREAAGLNKTQFARAVGASNPTVTDWEKSKNDGGIGEITGVRLTKICEVLKIEPRWLLHGEEAKEPLRVVESAPYIEKRAARLVLAFDDEEELLDLYRRSDERGRAEIKAVAVDEAGQSSSRRRDTL